MRSLRVYYESFRKKRKSRISLSSSFLTHYSLSFGGNFKTKIAFQVIIFLSWLWTKRQPEKMNFVGVKKEWKRKLRKETKQNFPNNEWIASEKWEGWEGRWRWKRPLNYKVRKAKFTECYQWTFGIDENSINI